MILKLCFWYLLPAGYAPAVISIFFLASVQIFLIGLVGEYVGAVLAQVRHRPMVVEASRSHMPTANSSEAGPEEGARHGS